jgi:hypothetical protein
MPPGLMLDAMGAFFMLDAGDMHVRLLPARHEHSSRAGRFERLLAQSELFPATALSFG